MFEGALGRGIKVAVIDSGVNETHPHIRPVAGGTVVAAGAENYVDILGHGTAVMAAIQEKAPEAEYYAVKVFHDTFQTSVAQLVEALEWCIAAKMDVINLSLGTRNAAHQERFAPWIEKAQEAGCLLVAAIEARGEVCYPGSMKGVLGVGADVACPREAYREVEGVYWTSPYPRPLPGVPVERNLSGISFAVANFSGFVTRMREGHPATAAREALALGAAR